MTAIAYPGPTILLWHAVSSSAPGPTQRTRATGRTSIADMEPTISAREEGAGAPPGTLSHELEAVVSRFAALVQRTTRRHGLDVGEQDAVLQDLRIRLWKALGSSELVRRAPASYVYKTMMSAIMDVLRGRGARPTRSLDEPQSPIADVARSHHPADAITIESDVGRAIDLALERLVESRRTAVRMHLAGYAREEIADLLGWTEARTRNLLYRGLDDLRAELTRMGFGPEATQ
jgi:RNA polymerase sigma factor (sigma-70 family)